MKDFETTEEIYKYLLDGNTLISNFINGSYNKNLVKLINGFPHTKIGDLDWYKDSWNFGNPEMWNKYREPEWFENIPKEGILCWVSDGIDTQAIKNIDVISSRIFRPNIRFEGKTGCLWSFATPLTKEDLKVFYDNSK